MIFTARRLDRARAPITLSMEQLRIRTMTRKTWIENELSAVFAARKRAFVQGNIQGARWLLECRDLMDFAGLDEDAGVFFLYADTEAEVDALIEKYAGERFNCIDGIFDLALPLREYHDITPEDWSSGERIPRRRDG